MTVTEALHEHVFRLTEELDIPAAFAGEPFIAPQGPYLRCSLGELAARASGIGRHAPRRLDGSLQLELEELAGDGLDRLSCLAARIAGKFPYGSGLDVDGPEGVGEIIFAAPQTAQPETDAGKNRITVTISFYAILFPKEGQ